MTQPKLILVVEDDEALRDSVCELLQEAGYSTIAADGGLSALATLRSLPRMPDLVLLDLMMPGMNGWQFRQEQLADPRLAGVPVVVMTASRDLRGINADEVVYKPLKLAKLLAVVERFTTQPQAQSPTAAETPSTPSTGKPRLATPEGTDTAPRASVRAVLDDVPSEQQLFAGQSALARRMRQYDWSRSPLGTSPQWPPSLRSALGICLGSSFPIAIYWGPHLALLYNDAWSPILGSKHPWALGRAAIEVWPELWDTIGPMFEQVKATAEPTYSEDSLLLMNRNGYTEECYFNYTFTPIRGPEGVDGIFNAVIETTFRVISERRSKALRTLAEHTARATSPEQACSLAANALASVGHDVPFCALYLVDENRIEARLAGTGGLPPHGHDAIPSTVPLTPASPNRTSRGIIGLLSMQARVELVSNLDHHFSPLPGGPWPVAATSALVAPIVTGPSSRPTGLLVVGVSPRRAVDEEYRQFVERAASQVATVIANVTAFAAERKRSEALAAIDRAKTVFFSNVSHEFRTPLTLMLGPAADLLAGVHGALTPNQQRELELLHRNGLRLQKLVNALLDFSRVEAGKTHAAFELVDLPSYTRELASAFHSAVERSGLHYELEFQPIADEIYVDRDMWEKIVLNLLSNALKFTFGGTIGVTLRDLGARVVLSVSDTGIGIPAEHLPRIFERFHRIEGVQSRTHEGSGIGLALVQELIKLHGGSVTVKSEVGVGTTFDVTLFKGKAHLPADRVVSARRTTTPPGAHPLVNEALTWLSPEDSEDRNDAQDALWQGTANTNYPRQRILLADDNADMREYIKRHLEKHWQVDVASDGAMALVMARQNPPDLVLTDVMMPGLDGFSLLKELGKSESTSNIPVLMLSARSGEEARVEGLQAGATDYLTKPFASRELLARVRTQLQLAGLRSELRAQREHLYALFLNAPIPIAVVFGESLVLEMANHLYCDLLGRDDIVGKPLSDGTPELAGQGFDHLLRQVMHTGQPYVGKEVRLQLHRNNEGRVEELYVNFTYAPFRRTDGVGDRVIVAIYDVTEQVTARRALEQAVARIRFLSEAMPQKIFTATPSGVVDYTNSQWQLFTGLPEGANNDVAWALIVHPEDVEESVRRWQHSLETGTPFEVEHRFQSAGGNYHWHLTRAHLMRNDDNIPVMWVGSSTDIDHVKQAEAELQQAVSFSDTFVGILGHDLRNPLNAITAAAQLLELRAESEKIAIPVSRIIVSANRMARMIVQLLDFTRIRLGRGIALVLTHVNLDELTRGIIDELEAARQARIQLTVLGDVSGTWDHDRLAQLLSNLIANACQHGRGDVPVTVHLDGEHADSVRLHVRNAGVIREDLLPVIFEPLRLDDSREKLKGSSGLGLGLYISHQIVLAHAGAIWVESNASRGTIFHIELPRSSPAEAVASFSPRTER
jgi:PAS domain S-box-containing protein